jgi:uncharacterized membrane protein
MGQINLTSNEFIYYGAIAGAALGLFLGIIVLILGFIKKERSYGVFGFLGSVILGPISGLLSLIVAAIFIWLILRRPKNESIPNSTAKPDSNASDLYVSDSKITDSDVS